ncbi:unnamed protein product [Lactuca virosa]|uniref:Uncharacterized protein n=1 Tax=Lactuca virosa TaxID=75947 RepID=A0AAU9MGS8_9ASTR|nr:unnamed protein product [Lactuca virosa]
MQKNPTNLYRHSRQRFRTYHTPISSFSSCSFTSPHSFNSPFFFKLMDVAIRGDFTVSHGVPTKKNLWEQLRLDSVLRSNQSIGISSRRFAFFTDFCIAIWVGFSPDFYYNSVSAPVDFLKIRCLFSAKKIHKD